MNLTLAPQTWKAIDRRVRAGQYQTPEDVIAAAVATLDQQEALGEFEPGELERLLIEGEQSGPPLDGQAVLDELRQLRQQ